jgi:hypothetical protein
MRYLIIIIGVLCTVACTNFKKQSTIDSKWLDASVKKSEALAFENVKSVLDTMNGEKLYLEIRKRFGKGCYPIEFLKELNLPEYDLCNIPYFYISKDNSDKIEFSLDTTQTSVFLLYNQNPFAELEIYKFPGLRFIDLIQGVDSIKWDLYNSRLQQRCTFFQCKRIIDIGHNQKGNAYLPYIFYTKDPNEIKVYDFAHKKDATLKEVAEKWLKD